MKNNAPNDDDDPHPASQAIHVGIFMICIVTFADIEIKESVLVSSQATAQVSGDQRTV